MHFTVNAINLKPKKAKSSVKNYGSRIFCFAKFRDDNLKSAHNMLHYHSKEMDDKEEMAQNGRITRL